MASHFCCNVGLKLLSGTAVVAAAAAAFKSVKLTALSRDLSDNVNSAGAVSNLAFRAPWI